MIFVEQVFLRKHCFYWLVIGRFDASRQGTCWFCYCFRFKKKRLYSIPLFAGLGTPRDGTLTPLNSYSWIQWNTGLQKRLNKGGNHSFLITQYSAQWTDLSQESNPTIHWLGGSIEPNMDWPNTIINSNMQLIESRTPDNGSHCTNPPGVYQVTILLLLAQKNTWDEPFA